MKNLIYRLGIIAIIVLCGFSARPTRYEKQGIVTMIYQPCEGCPEGQVTFIDAQGEEWVFMGSEDWYVGDKLTAIMSDRGTSDNYDDEVLKTTYTGYIPDELLAQNIDLTKYIY